jgi:hypothetical protein
VGLYGSPRFNFIFMGKSHFKKAIASLEFRIAEYQLQSSEVSDRCLVAEKGEGDRFLKIRNGDRVLSIAP